MRVIPNMIIGINFLKGNRIEVTCQVENFDKSANFIDFEIFNL
jgi:hypothetical protein